MEWRIKLPSGRWCAGQFEDGFTADDILFASQFVEMAMKARIDFLQSCVPKVAMSTVTYLANPPKEPNIKALQAIAEAAKKWKHDESAFDELYKAVEEYEKTVTPPIFEDRIV